MRLFLTKINLIYHLKDQRLFVERINIFGNNTRGIRNQFEIDEGDPYNEILANKLNNLKFNFCKILVQQNRW